MPRTVAAVLAVVWSIAFRLLPDPGEAPAVLPILPCKADYCEPVTDWPWSDATRYLYMQPDRVQLVKLNGAVVWTVPMRATQQPSLVAKGDFTGDGVPDYVFGQLWRLSPEQDCAGIPMSETELVFVDGATGAWSTPVAPMMDICWQQYGYPTHQYGGGTAYIGPFLDGGSRNQVVVFPYFATEGWVLTFDHSSGWSEVARASGNAIDYPSTPAYDEAYNSANTTPCAAIPGADHCYAKYSHVANAIFVLGGLLVLTTYRAVIYRPDFTPASEVVWGYEEGGGRNYGLVESRKVQGAEEVTLIGGCSVAKTRDTMRTHQLSGDNCELFHHYEYFLVQGQTIARHAGRSYGWFGTVGRWQDRAEFPFPSRVRLSGDRSWIVFNLYRDGQWRAQLLPNPADPMSAIEVPGWYIWGSVSDRFGNVFLAATRTGATSGTDVASYVPPWNFDFLVWSNEALRSVAHFDGIAPSLVLYPPGPTYHAADGDTFGLVESGSRLWPFRRMLVESATGEQSFVTVP